MDSGGCRFEGQQAEYCEEHQLAYTRISYPFLPNKAPAREPGSVTGDFSHIRLQLGHRRQSLNAYMCVQLHAMCS